MSLSWIGDWTPEVQLEQMKILRTREVVACSGSHRVSCKRSRSQEPYLCARMYIPAAPRAALPLPMMLLLCCWSPTAPQRPPTLLESLSPREAGDDKSEWSPCREDH